MYWNDGSMIIVIGWFQGFKMTFVLPNPYEEMQVLSPASQGMEEVAKHNTKEDCWVVLYGKARLRAPCDNKKPGLIGFSWIQSVENYVFHVFPILQDLWTHASHHIFSITS